MKRKQAYLALLIAFGCADAAPEDDFSNGEVAQSWCTDPNSAETYRCTRGRVEEAYVQLEDGTLQKVVFERIDGHAIMEGDILLDLPEDADVTPGRRPQAAGRTRTSSRWPNKTVPWRFGSPPAPNAGAVREAIAHWERNTGFKFPERTTQTDYVEFVAANGCSSSVGRVGGRQLIRLSSGCPVGSIIHEIGHAVGLWHEQSRADRDQHLIVLWENISSQNAYNFRTYVEQRQDGQDLGAFDFGSIMLYPSGAFSTNGKPTLLRRSTNSTYRAQRSALSAGDLAAIHSMYPGGGSGGSGGTGGGGSGGTGGTGGKGGAGGSTATGGTGGTGATGGSSGSAGTGGSGGGRCTGIPTWRAGTYGAGDVVQSGSPSRRYQCKPWPYSGWCGLAPYQPGVGFAWQDAWIDVGSCL